MAKTNKIIEKQSMAPYTRAQPPLAAGSFFFPTLPLLVLNFSSPPSLPLVSFESLSFRYLLPLIYFFSHLPFPQCSELPRSPIPFSSHRVSFSSYPSLFIFFAIVPNFPIEFEYIFEIITIRVVLT